MSTRGEHQPDVTPRSPSGDRTGPAAVRWVQRLERVPGLDALAGPVAAVSRLTQPPLVDDLLTGAAVGHAVHPAWTDVPIGLWSSSLLLDVIGRPQDRPASRLLLAAGLASAVPTALTGLAEWRRTSRPEQRVASVHAYLNLTAVGLYGSSLAVRGKAHRTGVALSFAATTVATVAGLLGGHLSTARKVGTRDEAFVADGVGPSLSRPAPPLGG